MNIRNNISLILSAKNVQPNITKNLNKGNFFLVHSFNNYYPLFFSNFILTVVKKIGGNGEVMKIPFNIKKWSVLSSPFAHKTAWTQFEKREYTYKISLGGISLPIEKILHRYFLHVSPPSVQIEYSNKVKIHNFK
jgi:ribosomal protein S10